MNFEFKLTYKLQKKLTDTDQLMAKLCEGGCTDPGGHPKCPTHGHPNCSTQPEVT